MNNLIMLRRCLLTGVLALIFLSPILIVHSALAQNQSQSTARTTLDPFLLAEIAKIKAIDNHAHPMSLVKEGEMDDQSDALTLDGLEPFSFPVRLRPDNPEYIGAWRSLYGYSHNDASETHLGELMEMKRLAIREQGDNYPAWVLEKLGIETMLANRVSMGRGLTAPRFKWVSFVDALLFPLSNEGARKVNPDRRAFYAGVERVLNRYLAESQQNGPPAQLDEYLAKVITPTLERQKRDGALAVKFEASYLRALDFAEVSAMEAKRIYASYVKGGEPQAEEYRALQDYLFRFIAREAGRLGLAVHIHIGLGAGGYFAVAGANPLLLEPVLNDPTLRRTNFVLIHSGWPFTAQAAALMSKPNVYLDFSAQTFLLHPRGLSEVIRGWLEFIPEKVLFGSDAFGLTPEIGWEEVGWLTTTSGRQALSLALTGMINDGEITRVRAMELARLVLRENAIKLYRLNGQ